MGEMTDKIEGRAKQAVGAVTGDEGTKREGQRQEDKGKLKGDLDSAIDKTQGALEDVKDKTENALDDLKDKIDKK
ncbi:MAG: CsbD family protein [Solirubrobacteraceae bacterium]